MIKRKCGIIGLGMVGSAVQRYFDKKENYQVFVYDKGKNIGSMDDVNQADFIYVCVPTPFKDGKCDTSIVEEVLGQLTDDKVVVLKSTVIPGTTERLQNQFPNLKILFNPEFLTEQTSDQDMSFPDRQIIGFTEKSYGVAKEIIQQLPLAPFERMIPATEAEIIKYFGNSLFAIKVAFCNQIYDLCKKLRADYDIVMDGTAADKRIGRTHMKIKHKGYRGYGGKCLPKDTKALLTFAKNLGIQLITLEATDAYNDDLLSRQELDPLDTDKGVVRPLEDESFGSALEIKFNKFKEENK